MASCKIEERKEKARKVLRQRELLLLTTKKASEISLD